MKGVFLLVPVLLSGVNFGSCWRRRRRSPPPPPSPVNGGWTAWSEYEPCPQSCGGSTQHRRRTCTNPSPAHGGQSCSGPSVESRPCNTQKCPVNGGWTAWSEYEPCPQSCGGSTQQRKRNCTNPSPAHGGQNCTGASVESRPCNTHNCPVDGGWTAWGEYERCGQVCGGSTQHRRRTCTNPPPAHGGQSCSGPSVESRSCNSHPCPAGHEKVIGNSVALGIGIPALIILVAVALLKLKQRKTQTVQIRDVAFQNYGNDTAFIIGESRLEKRFVH